MGAEFDRLVVKAHRGRTAAELAEASPDALTGVSQEDAERLEAAFGVKTIGDLADNRFVAAAMAIRDAADSPGFDPGPPRRWIDLFAANPAATYEAHPELFRLDFGPVFYRGRLDGTARVLVVGQDPSVNEIISQRVFVGRSGQRVQGFLTKLGLDRSYVMLNTFTFSIFDQFGGDNETLSHSDPILAYRNILFDTVAAENPLQAVVTVGSAARAAVDRWEGAGDIPRAHIIHPAFPDEPALLANWNTALATLRPVVGPDDGLSHEPDYGTEFEPGEVAPIPRRDLPFGVPEWHGVGDHATRAGNTVIEWRREPVDL